MGSDLESSSDLLGPRVDGFSSGSNANGQLKGGEITAIKTECGKKETRLLYPSSAHHPGLPPVSPAPQPPPGLLVLSPTPSWLISIAGDLLPWLLLSPLLFHGNNCRGSPLLYSAMALLPYSAVVTAQRGSPLLCSAEASNF
ncbi:hypothetical protein PIB30_066998 [Stylosanthes scabra]|uniref:Uncharacterized protein n=1 Tax=Stylosanthes scabra TaxID=79078 RepID=A0ABU6ULZ5_9FABA|nr:hypothetical protein [Stylosanthes scabra]